jgi:hypothetical protein
MRSLVTRRHVFAAAAGAALVGPVRAAAAAGDPAILARLIAREEAAAFAYHRQARPALFALATAEAAHAGALRTELAALGREGPEAPREVAALDPAARRVAEATGGASIAAAVALERSLVAAYREALVALAEPSILRTAGTILASHAQHHAVLSE